jgi:hypothetical protein
MISNGTSDENVFARTTLHRNSGAKIRRRKISFRNALASKNRNGGRNYFSPNPFENGNFKIGARKIRRDWVANRKALPIWPRRRQKMLCRKRGQPGCF